MTAQNETPPKEIESIETGYPRAPWGKRLLAFLIDSLISGLVLTLLSLLFIYVLAMGLSYQQPQFLEGLPEYVFYIWLAAVCCSFIWFNIYTLVRDTLWKGSSLGKHICGLMVINTQTNQPCDLIGSLIRNAPGLLTVYLAYFIVFIGLLFLAVEPVAAFTHQQGLRLGDRWAKTQVIEKQDYQNH